MHGATIKTGYNCPQNIAVVWCWQF